MKESLLAATERQRGEAIREALLGLGRELGRARTPVEAARAIFGVADRMWSWDAGFLTLYDPDVDTFSEVLSLDVMDGVRAEVPGLGPSLKATPHMRRIVEHGAELRLCSPLERAEEGGLPLRPFGDTSRRSASLMYVPLRWQDQSVGILSVQSYEALVFTEADLRALEGLAGHCVGALCRMQAVEALRGVGTVQDVTKCKQAEERRDQLERQLLQAQKMETVGHLAGGVAHDFNNILAGILMNLGLIQDEVRGHPAALELLSEVEKEAQRAAGLVRQLLLFARRQVMTVRRFDLEGLLDHLLQMLRRLTGADIELARVGAREPSWIQADAGMLEHAVTHLVLNARDSMPKGGRIVLRTDRVRLDATVAMDNPEARAGDFICLTVADTGGGMEAATMRHIFEPFFSTKGIGQGTGLGLSAVYGIVRQHHGWVEVESTVGRGSTFRVFLPTAPMECGSERKSAGPLAGSQPAEAEVILVVDDEPAVCQAAARVLSRRGYRVLSAPDGASALDLAAREPGVIHLVLTDLVMPGPIGGIELAVWLRQARPDIRVVVMSGFGSDPASLGRDVPPGTVLLQKPFLSDTLVGVIREALETDPPPAA
jgi:signal transduction histidine kinase